MLPSFLKHHDIPISFLLPRSNSWSDSDEPSCRRARTSYSTRRDVSRAECKTGLFDLLSDNLIIEIFKYLPHFPDLLRARQVSTRWYHLSCSPWLWKTLSFEGHEYVTSFHLNSLCNAGRSLKRLRKLSLSRVHGVNDISVRMIPRTECAATLESVDLSWCSGATDKSVVEFSRCPGLRELRLAHCRDVTRRSVRILAVRCPRLEILDMNCITGLRDSLLSFIGQNCPCLRVLNIANGKNISDEGVTHIAKGCPRLQVLDLSWCGRVSDWGVSTIASHLPNLREIGLSETKVTNAGLSELVRGCPKLEHIHLARCTAINDFGVENIITSCGSKLKSLNLASCQNVSDSLVERLLNECPSLSCLDVSKLPCRTLSPMLDRLPLSRKIEVYF